MRRRREVDYDPHPDRGKPQLQKGDIDILGPLNRYKLLTTTAIAMLSGRPMYVGCPFRERLTRVRKDGAWLGTFEEESKGPKCVDLVYVLNENGRKQLRQLGVEPNYQSWMRGPNEHDFATCMSVASLEIYAAQFGLEFIPFDRFHERSGKETPHLYEGVRITWKGETITEEFMPDYPAIGLKYPNGNTLPIMAWQTDRGTETLIPSTLKQSSVLKHMLATVELDRKGEFRRRYQLSSDFYVVPILTWSETRKQNIMKLAQKIGGDDLFVFGVVPNFARFSLRSKPTDALFAGLVRADGSPFSFTNPEQ